MKKIYFSILILFFTMSIAQALPKNTLTVAVSSNFESTFKQLQPLFEQKYKISLVSAFASTGKLYTQIINGAPFDVFLSGDEAHIRLLEKAGFAKSSASFIYAIGELRVFAPGLNIKRDGLTELISTRIKKIAIANPKTTPYGLAAKQVLQRKKLWSTLHHKLVVGENVGQVAIFLITRNADAGFLAGSQLIEMMKHIKHPIDSMEVWKVPSEMYTPIRQYATPVISTHHPQNADIFLKFLRTRISKKIISENGYHF